MITTCSCRCLPWTVSSSFSSLTWIRGGVCVPLVSSCLGRSSQDRRPLPSETGLCLRFLLIELPAELVLLLLSVIIDETVGSEVQDKDSQGGWRRFPCEKGRKCFRICVFSHFKFKINPWLTPIPVRDTTWTSCQSVTGLTQRGKKQFTLTGMLEQPINLTPYTSLEYGRKLEKTHSGIRRTYLSNV